MSNVIPGISALKKRKRAGLLNVASLLPEGVENWRRGIDYVPEGCTVPDATPFCDPDRPDKAAAAVQSAIKFQPFGIVATDGCNDPWFATQEFYDRASRTLTMGQSAILARELLQSTVTDNPDLQSTATDLTALMGTPGAVGWNEGTTALIYNMVNAGYVGDITIHAPSWLAPSFEASQVGWVDFNTGQHYIDTHPVVFDPGYSGLVGPGGDAGLATPPQSGWVYATGPVEYDFAPEVEDEAVNFAGNNRQNDRYVVAERPGILRFDPCQVMGILIRVCQAGN